MSQWTEFKRQESLTRDEARSIIVSEIIGTKVDVPGNEEVIERMVDDLLSGTVYTNNLYSVAVYGPEEVSGVPCPMVHLSIKRNDRSPMTNWSHLQRIKNIFVGEECEAVQLFPAESRLVDMANQYHLWILADKSMNFPFGFNERCVESQREHSDTKQNLEPTVVDTDKVVDFETL